MSQHSQIDFPPLPYNRGDYAALRAYCLKLPFTVIERYYTEDSPQRQQGLERYLIKMREELIERASIANPAIADVLRKSRTGQIITDKALAILIEAADAKPAPPYPHQRIAQWFRARVAHCLIQEGLQTIADLQGWITARGHRWWAGIPRIGQSRAQAIVRWLKNHATTLGEIDPKYLQAPSPTATLPSLVLDPNRPDQLAPLSQMVIPHALSGHEGINRCQQFAWIQANNDHEAIQAYLARFQGHTERVYRKELERLLLWSVMVAQKPISSLLVSDAEAYKLFIAKPDAHFVGRNGTKRFTPTWKPFSGPLSSASQRHAVQIIRTAFDWLVKVRYLAGNPWVAVRDPEVAQAITPIQIERALPATLWDKLVAVLTELAHSTENAQIRIALAAMLLMGDSGLRRTEVAQACRAQLCQSAFSTNAWELRVLGKRNKWREVPISQRTIDALKAHWQDRQVNFELAIPSPLLSPLVIPETKAARQMHSASHEAPYASHSLYRLVIKTLRKVCDTGAFDLEETSRLLDVSAHAFRHTFGTQAVAKDVPIDVVQKVLGHASVATTSLYVKAEKQRMMEEVGKYFQRMAE